MKSHRIKEQTIQLNHIDTDGSILDIGGGGEGIIGRLNGRQVSAIDLLAKELRESKTDSEKIVADARKLCFTPRSFDLAIAFFSLMYMRNTDHERAFKEVHRALKAEGTFLVWDVRIPSQPTSTEVFIVPLKIVLPRETVRTEYGVKWTFAKKQDLDLFKALARNTNFHIANAWSKQELFYLELRKGRL